MNQDHIFRDRVMQLLDYNPDTGKFTNKTNRGGTSRIGKEAGRTSNGYRRITIDGKEYFSHRLAFLIITGRMPLHEIDHISCDKLDNRFSNLREATASENMRNRGRLRNNKSGFIGVTFNKRHNKWRAYIYIDYNNIHLGYFNNPVAAAEARNLAAIRLHLSFARLNFNYSLTEDNKIFRRTDF